MFIRRESATDNVWECQIESRDKLLATALNVRRNVRNRRQGLAFSYHVEPEPDCTERGIGDDAIDKNKVQKNGTPDLNILDEPDVLAANLWPMSRVELVTGELN